MKVCLESYLLINIMMNALILDLSSRALGRRRPGRVLLAAALVCSLVRQLGETSGQIAAMTGALAITAIFTTGMQSMIGLADTMLADMEAYAKLLLPVMCSAAVRLLCGIGCLPAKWGITQCSCCGMAKATALSA